MVKDDKRIIRAANALVNELLRQGYDITGGDDTDFGAAFIFVRSDKMLAVETNVSPLPYAKITGQRTKGYKL